MSVESAKKFAGNFAFVQAVMGAKDKTEKQKIIRNAGYDFTESELASVQNDLSDSDLDSVAGGCIHVCHNCCDY